jgi:hypothetical protein
MLKVDRQIQKNDRGHYTDRSRDRHHVQQPNATLVRNECKPDCRRRKENADQNRVHEHDTEIVGPPPSSPDRLFAPGSDHFPQGHHSKNAAKGG